MIPVVNYLPCAENNQEINRRSCCQKRGRETCSGGKMNLCNLLCAIANCSIVLATLLCFVIFGYLRFNTAYTVKFFHIIHSKLAHQCHPRNDGARSISRLQWKGERSYATKRSVEFSALLGEFCGHYPYRVIRSNASPNRLHRGSTQI